MVLYCLFFYQSSHVYYNVRERSLAITCPIACKELLMREEPVVIEMEEDNKKDQYYKYFDQPLFGQLEYIRDSMLKLVQDRSIGIWERMALLLGMRFPRLPLTFLYFFKVFLSTVICHIWQQLSGHALPLAHLKVLK